MPRRHQLRGPFGQMLMEEMAKTEVKMEAESTDPQPPDVLAVTSAVTPDTSAAPTISHQRTRYIIVSLIILQRRTAPEFHYWFYIHTNSVQSKVCFKTTTMILLLQCASHWLQ